MMATEKEGAFLREAGRRGRWWVDEAGGRCQRQAAAAAEGQVTAQLARAQSPP